MFSWGTVQQQQQQRRQQQQQQRRQQHPPQTRLLRGSALFMFSSYAAFMKRLLSSTARSLSSFRRKRIHRWMAWLPDHLSVLRIGMVALCRPPLCSLLVIDTHGRRQGLSRDLLKKRKKVLLYSCFRVFIYCYSSNLGRSEYQSFRWLVWVPRLPQLIHLYFWRIVRKKDIYATSWIWGFNLD